MQRFIRNCSQRRTGKTLQEGFVTAKETREAEWTVIRLVQAGMREDDNHDKLKIQLRLFEDEEGNIRGRGRLDHANISEDAKYPLVLPRRPHVTDWLCGMRTNGCSTVGKTTR